MELIVWLPTFPNVMCSTLVELARPYIGRALIVCPPPISEADAARYDDTVIRSAFRLKITDKRFFNEAAREIFTNHAGAIHLFGGFLGITGQALEIYAKEFNGKNAYIFTEKPSIRPVRHFNAINKILRHQHSKLIYKRAYESISSSVRGIFVTGEMGVRQLKSFGIPGTKLFEAMYTHNDDDRDAEQHGISRDGNGITRFIYIGRFELLNRGLDTLISACDQIKNSNWQLDMVGGYGADADKIIAWAKASSRVRYLGEWSNRDIIHRLAEYDVCISPTRIDGWRIQVNQAIVAGCGTITTTEAISDELIRISNSGIVIPPGNVKKLRQAMEFAILNPQEVMNWKQNAFAFRHRISNAVVGKYMNDVINYCQTQQGDRPQCPWIEK